MLDMYVVELGDIREFDIGGAPCCAPFKLIMQPFINFSKALDYYNELKIYCHGKRFLKLYMIIDSDNGSDEFINLKIEKGCCVRNNDLIVNDYYFIAGGFLNN